MLKSNELRIGNIITRKGWLPTDNKFHEIIVSHNDITACFIGPETFKPIPLTEDILLKCGFSYGENGFTWLSYHSEVPIISYSAHFQFKKNGDIKFAKIGGVAFGINCIKKWNNNMKYLHQLQNLYFCLCGEELTINL